MLLFWRHSVANPSKKIGFIEWWLIPLLFKFQSVYTRTEANQRRYLCGEAEWIQKVCICKPLAQIIFFDQLLFRYDFLRGEMSYAAEELKSRKKP